MLPWHWSHLKGEGGGEEGGEGNVWVLSKCCFFLFSSLCPFPPSLGLGWTRFHFPGVPQEIPDPSRCGPSCHHLIPVLWWGPHCEWTKETGLWPWAHHSHHSWREAFSHCSLQEVDALSLIEFFKMRKFPHQWLKLSRLVLKLINVKGRPKLLS